MSIKASSSAEFPHAKIIVKTPRVSQGFLNNLLVEKEAWIREQLRKLEQNGAKRVNLEDEVLLFGEICSIDLEEATHLRELLQKMRVNNEKNILRCYDDFYKQFAQNHIVPRVEYFAKCMDLEYQEIKFRKMKSRWGSCSSTKILTFNTELIKIEEELIDYVIVHELAHLVHMNHSAKFHSLVEQYIPHAKHLRKNLKKIHILSE
ncbi:MAG: M48 family metallopeptidase [Epsilonproteobacteria bacterium]|nr:M48 family metallopeptidase [Campylobacterota bacterium]PIP09906.1 MAG: hypothetical protein COX50_08490 [Sulfurimonas sp. CG23_combo_of_CG06-09_8_20_14_all_36_33]PIS24730.1 MAG: M48 family peptidase [Sulfurimonas sp. CG08_land_8_20_14_0_20_36_33]PIU35949.1 MAG: M48 family peptidase [Sulfurimonas sp. CG07_land_8_20_14_0_80_36_56]PIV03007.1 MAG: M48 family peptidase [Sulfurimonas sp. CG03_land_8_20_14_0_80_36_25]PIV36889.1 MAG: M48 family peptidase [Sulfurimonas sp. CG02_land_8_20_14_3_00_36